MVEAKKWCRIEYEVLWAESAVQPSRPGLLAWTANTPADTPAAQQLQDHAVCIARPQVDRLLCYLPTGFVVAAG